MDINIENADERAHKARQTTAILRYSTAAFVFFVFMCAITCGDDGDKLYWKGKAQACERLSPSP